VRRCPQRSRNPNVLGRADINLPRGNSLIVRYRFDDGTATNRFTEADLRLGTAERSHDLIRRDQDLGGVPAVSGTWSSECELKRGTIIRNRQVAAHIGRAALEMLVLMSLLALTCAQEQAVGQNESAHRVRYVQAEPDVRLEVLDWGGSGRPLVLLPGSGNTAHVFDDFAPKLTGCCHVYAITRRGFGASSRPASGYDDQRLADDVLQVLRSLKIERPVLVGHSMAGGELTALGNQHLNRLAGLVYLDALGDPRDWPASDPAYRELANKLPDARNGPRGLDHTSFSAYRASQLRNERYAFPESELRQLFVANRDGTVGAYKASTGSVHAAIGAGQKKRDYSNIRIPVLAIFEYPRPPDPAQSENEEERATRKAYASATAAYVDRWTKNLKTGVPAARFVDLPGAGHFVFLTREADVLEEIRRFVARLP
jgi:pimeloyl-ACP methyl ester carboxylesterase